MRPTVRLLLAPLLATIASAAAAAELRGFVSDGPAGLLAFQPCHGSAPAARLLKLSDRSPDTALVAGVAAVRQVMEDRERPLYVEFAGEVDGDRATARRFQRAIGHVLSCASAPADVAAGTRLAVRAGDGGWRFVATAGGGRLELAPGRAIRFPAAAFVPAPNGGRTQVFDAWSREDGGTIRVEVTEELCLEEHAETATGARVAVRYASMSAHGCATRF